MVRLGAIAGLALVAACSSASPSRSGSPQTALAPAESGEIVDRLEPGQLNAAVRRHQEELAECLFVTQSTRAAVVFMVVGNGRVGHVVVNGAERGRLANCIRGVLEGIQFPRSRTLQTKGSFEMSR